MLVFLCCLFLPGLNWDHCDDKENGYTCDDLKRGVAELEKLLLVNRSGSIGFRIAKQHPVYTLYSRLFSVGVALATGARPLFSFEEGWVKPDIAEYRKARKDGPDFRFCQNITSVDGEMWFNIEPSPATLLLNPTLIRLYKRLGPAALHILVHFTLSLNESIAQPVNSQPVKISLRTSLNDLLRASRSPVVQNIPNFVWFMINLIRGRAPKLCSRVGHQCWPARSYLAGGVNPLYPGTDRSNLDISRSVSDCGDPRSLQDLVDLLI